MYENANTREIKVFYPIKMVGLGPILEVI